MFQYSKSRAFMSSISELRPKVSTRAQSAEPDGSWLGVNVSAFDSDVKHAGCDPTR